MDHCLGACLGECFKVLCYAVCVSICNACCNECCKECCPDNPTAKTPAQQRNNYDAWANPQDLPPPPPNNIDSPNENQGDKDNLNEQLLSPQMQTQCTDQYPQQQPPPPADNYYQVPQMQQPIMIYPINSTQQQAMYPENSQDLNTNFNNDNKEQSTQPSYPYL